MGRSRSSLARSTLACLAGGTHAVGASRAPSTVSAAVKADLCRWQHERSSETMGHLLVGPVEACPWAHSCTARAPQAVHVCSLTVAGSDALRATVRHGAGAAQAPRLATPASPRQRQLHMQRIALSSARGSQRSSTLTVKHVCAGIRSHHVVNNGRPLTTDGRVTATHLCCRIGSGAAAARCRRVTRAVSCNAVLWCATAARRPCLCRAALP